MSRPIRRPKSKRRPLRGGAEATSKQLQLIEPDPQTVITELATANALLRSTTAEAWQARRHRNELLADLEALADRWQR
jgi:hypothetical protein